MEERLQLQPPMAGAPRALRWVTAGLVLAVAILPLVIGGAWRDRYDLPKWGAVTGMVLLSAWAALMVMAIGGRRPGRTQPALVVGVLLGAGITASATQAGSLDHLLGALEQLVVLGLAAMVGAWCFTTARARHGLTLAIATGGLLTAGLGLLQYAGRDQVLAEGGLLPGFLAPWANLPQTDRPGSSFGHVNMASEVVALGAVAALHLVGRGGGGWWLRGLAALAVLPMAALLLVGGSRASWGAVALGILPLVVVGARRCRRRWLAGALLLLLLLGGGLVLADRHIVVPGRGGEPATTPLTRLREALNPQAGTFAERRVLWANTLTMIEEHPWLGLGPGQWAVRYPHFVGRPAVHDPERFHLARQPAHAHQDFLERAAEWGLPVFGLVLVLKLVAMVRLWRAPGGRAGVGILLALDGLALFAFPWHKAVPALVGALWIGAGLAGRGAGRSWVPAGRGPALAALALLGLALPLGAGFVGRARASEALARASRPVVGATEAAARQRWNQLEAAAARAPGSVPLLLALANARGGAGLLGEAERAGRALLRVHPGLVHAHLMLAGVARQAQRFAEAELAVREALALLPDAPEVRTLAGALALERAYRLDATAPALALEARREAAAHLRRAVALRAYGPEARRLLLGLLLDVGVRGPEPLRLIREAAQNTAHSAEGTALVALLAHRPEWREFAPDDYGPAGSETLRLWARARHLDARLALRAEAARRVGRLRAEEEKGGATSSAERRAALAAVEAALARGGRDLELLFDRAWLQETLGAPGPAAETYGLILRRLGPTGVLGQRARQAREAEAGRLRTMQAREDQEGGR